MRIAHLFLENCYGQEGKEDGEEVGKKGEEGSQHEEGYLSLSLSFRHFKSSLI